MRALRRKLGLSQAQFASKFGFSLRTVQEWEQGRALPDRPGPSSKLNPHEFIGGFERLAITCLHGDADKRSSPGRPKRTPNPHCAAVGIDRAAPSNCRTGAQPNSSLVLPSLGPAALGLAVALVAAMARKPGDRPAGNRLALASKRLVSDLEISITWSLARWASEGLQ